MIEVSVEAWHAILYLVTPWQYLPRLGMQFYILSRLGSVCRGLVFCSISFHALADWQYLPRLGMLFYILSRLGSICRGLACYSISCHALAVSAKGPTSKNPRYKSSSWDLKNNPGLQNPRLRNPELRKLTLNKQRHAGVLKWEIPCEHAEDVVDFASGRGYLIGKCGKFAKTFLPKISQK